jgi:hypothetical protein
MKADFPLAIRACQWELGLVLEMEEDVYGDLEQQIPTLRALHRRLKAVQHHAETVVALNCRCCLHQ